MSAGAPETAKCACCGDDVSLGDAEPAFRFPDAYVALDATERQTRALAGADYCRIGDLKTKLPCEGVDVYVRAVVPFGLRGLDRVFRWGVWVKMDRQEDFVRIVKTHSSPTQAEQPPMSATIANELRAYEGGLGLPCRVQLVSPRQRPMVLFDESVDHPFAIAQREGIFPHQAERWLRHFFD